MFGIFSLIYPFCKLRSKIPAQQSTLSHFQQTPCLLPFMLGIFSLIYSLCKLCSKIPLNWWRRRVLPPGPIHLFHASFRVKVGCPTAPIIRIIHFKSKLIINFFLKIKLMSISVNLNFDDKNFIILYIF